MFKKTKRDQNQKIGLVVGFVTVVFSNAVRTKKNKKKEKRDG